MFKMSGKFLLGTISSHSRGLLFLAINRLVADRRPGFDDESKRSNPGCFSFYKKWQSVLLCAFCLGPVGDSIAGAFEDALNSTNIAWRMGGNSMWFGQTNQNHDGVAAVQSGAIATVQETWFEATLVGPKAISFYWAISSTTNRGWLKCLTNGVAAASITGCPESGNPVWQYQQIQLGSGIHTIRWVYSRDGWDSYAGCGQNAAWLDQLTIEPQLPAIPSISRAPWPDNQSLYGGEGTLLTVESNGGLPLYFQWLHNDSPILDATNSELKIVHLQTSHSGAYRTIISNSAGSVTTAVATINVLQPLPLDAALDISNTTWVTGGDSPWFGVGNMFTNNNASARNGNILAGESSWVETTFIGPGVLTFDYYGRDVFEARFLTVTFAGMTMNCSRSPGTSWNTSQYRIPYGPQTCRWTYYYYDTNSSGLEGVWLDNVRFDADPPGPPAFVKQPISVELFEGHTGKVSCVITGSYPASFQWFFNSIAMLNATNMDLILENAGAPQEGSYWVVVSNAYGITTSSTATVSVTTSEKVSAALGVTGWIWISGGTAPPWRIVAVSADGTNSMRSGFAGTREYQALDSWLMTSITGPGNLSFKWKLNAVTYECVSFNVGGISISNRCHANDQTWKTCSTFIPEGTQTLQWRYAHNPQNREVANNNYAAYLDQVIFTPSPPLPPSFVTQPRDLMILSSSNATFTAVIASPWRCDFQWFHDNSIIPDATNATLVLSNVTPSQAGRYFVIASNVNGFTNSIGAQLTVIEKTGLAESLDATHLTWSSGGDLPWFGQMLQSHDGSDAAQPGLISPGQTSWLETTVQGPGTLKYWIKAKCRASTFSLPLMANPILSYLDWQLQITHIPAGVQTLRWTFLNGDANDAVWLDEIQYVPIVISEQPESRFAYPGQEVVFKVGTIGTGPRYQWQLNGTNIVGATNDTLILSCVTSNHSGSYSVTISNANSFITSSNATLKVGFLIAWGLQPWERSDISNAVDVTMGEDHTMVLKSDGTVLGWGYYMHWDSGQREYSPVVLPDNLTNIVAIASGWHCTLFLRQDGTVYTAGSMAILTNQPPGLTNVIAIAGGNGANLALKQDGTVVAWGYDGFGGALTNVPSSLSNVVKIAACTYANLALKDDGTVVGWGSDWYGQTNVPATLTNVSLITMPSYSAVALTRDGDLVTWGSGFSMLAQGLTNVIELVSGHGQVLALQRNGTILAFGSPSWNLGIVPVGLSNVLAVAASETSDLVLLGPPLPAKPAKIVSAKAGNGQFQIRIPTVAQQRYTLEYVESLSATNWTPLKSVDGFGYGVMRTLSDSNVTSQQRFYRVRVE